MMPWNVSLETYNGQRFTQVYLAPEAAIYQSSAKVASAVRLFVYCRNILSFRLTDGDSFLCAYCTG